MCNLYTENYLAWESPGIGRGITFLTLQGIICFIIIIIIESGKLRILGTYIASGSRSRVNDVSDIISLTSVDQFRIQEDDDVVAERERIANTPLSRLLTTDSLILSGLKKYYGDFLAVEGLSVGIPQGECFGLLGINGAGKTTTFKMLTGDEIMSSGEAFLDGLSIKNDMKQVGISNLA